MMKKLLVLMLVLCTASLANAVLVYTDGTVEYHIEKHPLLAKGQLLGKATSAAVYDGFLGKGLITPDPTTDGAMPGLDLDAGDLGSVADFGTVWNMHGEASALSSLVAPSTWFVFDLLGAGRIDVYDNQTFEVKGSFGTPEPMTMALLGLGVLFLRRRK